MKHLILVLATTLLASSTPQTTDGLRVRYLAPAGGISLTVSHDIDVSDHKSIARREFSFDLALATEFARSDTVAVTVTIEQARGSFTAHDMKERLGTRHLTGKSFSLSIDDDGRQLKIAAAGEAPVIDLGLVTPGFSVAELLADMLPMLPDEAVAVGATWTTERAIRSLEGWAWGVGQLTSRHRVTAVDSHRGHTVVEVETEAEAGLDPIEGQRSYSGKLTRKLQWTFDATEGRLLKLSMEQESDGICELPQGDLPLQQHTRIKLAPRS